MVLLCPSNVPGTRANKCAATNCIRNSYVAGSFLHSLFRLLHQINKALIKTLKRTKPSFGVNFLIIVINTFKLIVKTQRNNHLTEKKLCKHTKFNCQCFSLTNVTKCQVHKDSTLNNKCWFLNRFFAYRGL